MIVSQSLKRDPPRRPRNLASLLAQKALETLGTVWAAVTITFFALRLASGDPVATLLAQGRASTAQIEALRQVMGFDQSLLIQYLGFLRRLLQGDLGPSLYTGQPVLRVIGEQFPHTLQLGSAGILMALLIGITLGALAAWRADQWIGRLAATLTGLGTSLPVTFTGILALFILRSILQTNPNLPGLSALQRLILPALVLGFASGAAIGRVVYAGLRDQFSAPYILAARARGVHGNLRLLWHALRPSLPPAVALSALEMAFLFSGTVVTETIFSRPGLGRLLLNSILQGDFPVAQGIVVLAAIFYTLTQALSDLLSTMLDPRIRGRV